MKSVKHTCTDLQHCPRPWKVNPALLLFAFFGQNFMFWSTFLILQREMTDTDWIWNVNILEWAKSDLYHHILVIFVWQKFDSSLSSKLRAQGSSFSSLLIVSSQILSHIALLLGSLSKQLVLLYHGTNWILIFTCRPNVCRCEHV